MGGLLTKAGRDVTLIDQWPEHVEAMKRGGLRLSGTCGEHRIPVTALHLHEAQSAEPPWAARRRVRGGDYLNGHVCEQGRRRGVAMPFNDAVVRAVNRHGAGMLRPDPRNLEPLLEMLPR